MSRVKSAQKRRPPVPALPDRPTRLRVMWRRQRRMIRPALMTLVIGAAAIGFLAGVQALGRGQSFSERVGQATARLGLRVRQVVVEGRQKTPEAALRAAIRLEPGDPLLSFSLSAARARIETIQWVQQAEVERRLPDTLVVRLTERRPFAVWQHDGHFVLIDRDGNVVTDSDVATFASEVPLVVGPGAPAAAAALVDALATQPDVAGRVTASVRVGERRWNLRMKNGADILLPEAGETAALARLEDLQATHKILDRPVNVDLRLSDRLVIRPLPGAGPAIATDPKDAASARRPT
jgi:cell division protein FtsQ